MSKSNATILSAASAVPVFKKDREETHTFLEEMKEHLKTLCAERDLVYPRAGRGRTGLLLNLTYALHFRLKGLTPLQGAEEYADKQTGHVLQPIAQPAAGCVA